MTITVDFQNCCDAKETPSIKELENWVAHALGPTYTTAIVSVTLVTTEEIKKLNLAYRQKDKPTNVLSFPNPIPQELSEGFIGDIVVCASIIEEEAKAQHKPLTAHWAHMIVHSVLHLQGYDHAVEHEALLMEAKEIEILHQLGFLNPYAETL